MLSRWQGVPELSRAQYHVIDPAKHAISGVSCYEHLDALPAHVKPDVIVLAVKPQLVDDTLPAYRARFGNTPLYLSIAAGKTLGTLSMHLGEEAQIVRAMPNTPALIGEGITALVAPPYVSAATKALATKLMEAVGGVLWLEKESLMDAVTALSGSGPAYVFLFLESLAEAGMEAGLSPELARRLAVSTLIGSCKLAETTGESFATLREQVVSPGGTTAAALSVLMRDDALKELIREAVGKAAERSFELSK